MTLLELVTYLRQNILHDTGGTGVAWQNYNEDDYDSVQLRWKNEELVSNINEAIRQVYRRINPIIDTYSLPVTAQTNGYLLKPYIMKVLEVRRADGKLLTEKSIFDYQFSQFNTDTGDLEAFITDDKTNIIRVYPIPIANETLSLHVYRLPKESLSWDDYDVSPELREEFQIPMLYGAAGMCYLKDEANTFDPRRSSDMFALFDRDFPFTSAYSNTRKAKTANRPVRYGGL